LNELDAAVGRVLDALDTYVRPPPPPPSTDKTV
jgi:hypothetical protein